MHIRNVTKKNSLSRAFDNRKEKWVNNFSVNFKFKIGKGRELSIRYFVQSAKSPSSNGNIESSPVIRGPKV
jgi:hypothetical protein